MELARHIWKTSVFVYKSGLPPLMRHSSSSSASKAALSCLPKYQDNSTASGLSSRNNKSNDELILSAIGVTDELSCYIGLAREFACDSSVEHPYVDKLKRVQMILFDLNHVISRSRESKSNLFEDKHTKDLEEWITEYATQLPPPEDFIIPGGGKACASLHVARAICQRAERTVTKLVDDGTLDSETRNYLNRLSDFLLTVSRIAAKCDQRTENIYIPRAEIPEDK